MTQLTPHRDEDRIYDEKTAKLYIYTKISLLNDDPFRIIHQL